MMNETCERRDLVGKRRTTMLLWGLPIAVIVSTGIFSGGGWVVTLSWTLAFAVMGIACLVNARGCGRIHCYFTGPFFLLMAAASALHGSGLWDLGPEGWSYIGQTALVGGLLLCCLPEWLWGRYRRTTPANPNQR